MKKSLFVLFVALSTSTTALAHSRLSATGNFPPRSSNSGIQNGPCGTDAKLAPVQFKPGQTVALQWEETIHHSGRFQAFISSGGDLDLSNGTTAGTTKLFDIVQSFSDANVPHEYSQQVTLPNITCTDCTIQLVQINTDGGATNPVYYFSCADVALSTATPAATPTPIPFATPLPSSSPVAVNCLPTATPSPVTVAPTAIPIVIVATPTPVPTAIPATFTAVKANIITPQCVGCHQGTNPPDGYNFSTYAGVFTSVNTATPTSSVIYTTTLDGAMPEGGPALTSTQQNLLLRWIQAGAPNN